MLDELLLEYEGLLDELLLEYEGLLDEYERLLPEDPEREAAYALLVKTITFNPTTIAHNVFLNFME